MPDTQTATLVLKDQAGEYYLLPLETLAQCRISAEDTGEVERVLAEAEADDVAGYRDSRLPQAATAPRQTQPVCFGFLYGMIIQVDCSPPPPMPPLID
jgi:hypothetical protein